MLTTPQWKKNMTMKGDYSPDMQDEMEDHHVWVEENVPQLLEYQKDKIFMVVGQTF